jgi:predicted DNA-binding ribbon-helix-helix protein
MPKFMQTLEQEVYNKLQALAKERGITVQELIRAVIIPEWLKEKEKR